MVALTKPTGHKLGKPHIFSRRRNIMERQVCPDCSHLHRSALSSTCSCCKLDRSPSAKK